MNWAESTLKWQSVEKHELHTWYKDQNLEEWGLDAQLDDGTYAFCHVYRDFMNKGRYMWYISGSSTVASSRLLGQVHDDRVFAMLACQFWFETFIKKGIV